MELYIVTLTGTAFELRVSPNDTIMSIKSKIQRCEGIPVGQQHLIWKEDELFDHQSLRDCSIPGGATLRLVLGMRGGPISTYRPPPVATAAATIRFTPTVLFTASQKPSETHQESSDQDKSSTPLPKSSDVTEEAVTTSAASTNTASAAAATTASVATSTTSDKQKQITFLFLNTTAAAALADRVDFVRVVGQQPQQEESTNSLLGSEKSADPSPPATSPPSPPPVSAAQSLPFLQTEESALSCEQLPQSASTTSEPSVLKAAASNDPATAILAGYVYAAAAAAAAAGGESDTDSDTAAAAYLLRPTSPEWDNRDLSVTPPPVVAPPLEFPFFATSEEVGVEDEEEDDDDENDSLADLKDTLIYYQTGDVLFGPRGRGKRSASTASFLRGGGYGDVESSESQQQSSSRQLVLTQAKMEECESLAEKMRQIRAQLTQQKEKALRNRQRLGCSEKIASHDLESSSPSSSDFHLPPLASKEGKPYQPRIRSEDQVVFPSPSGNRKTTTGTTALPSSLHTRSHQHHIRRRPHTSTTATSSASAFDLSKAGCGGVSSTSSSASSSLDNLAASMAAVTPFLLPQFPPPEPTRRLRSSFQSSYLSGHAAAPSSSSSNNNEMAPDKTTSETKLDAAAFIPGFGGGGNGYFSRSGRGLRQRRFGTVQPPDFSEISGGDDHHYRRSRHHHLREFFTSFEATTEDSDHEKAAGSSLPHIFPPLLPPPTHQPASAASKTTSSLLPTRPFTASLASFSGSSSSSTSAHPSSDSLLVLLPHHSPPPQQQQRGHSPTLKDKKETLEAASATPTMLPPIPRLLRGSIPQGSDCEDAKASSPIFRDAGAPPLPQQQQQSPAPQPPPSSSSSPKSRKDTSESARPSPPKLKTNRCASCNRRTGLVDSYTCRCERNFCSKHRYAELHACPFDYKAEARRCIRESNPVVTAAKLPKI